MSSTRTTKMLLQIPVWILLIAIVVLGVVQSGKLTNLVDPEGFLFVLVGGIAMAMVSFPGADIWRALRGAASSRVNETEVRISAHFWEAPGRGYWMVGVLRSILHLMMFFISMKTVEVASIQWLIRELAQYLLAALYGMLLAVICFIPCWKLMGKFQHRPVDLPAEQQPLSIPRSRLRSSAVFGYFLFFAVLVFSFRRTPISAGDLIAIKPAMLLVLGGTIAFMLFTRGTKSGPMLSTAFAAMGLMGCLLGTIQMLFGMSEGPAGIGQMAGTFAFLVSSSLSALFGIVLAGAPLDERMIRTGRSAGPSASLVRISLVGIAIPYPDGFAAVCTAGRT